MGTRRHVLRTALSSGRPEAKWSSARHDLLRSSTSSFVTSSVSVIDPPVFHQLMLQEFQLTPSVVQSLVQEQQPHSSTTYPFAVAVSGGLDSLTLVLLLSEWLESILGPNHNRALLALTVDHALRPEAEAEATQVAKWMASRNIAHVIHRFDWDKPKVSQLQLRARERRYAVFERVCAEHEVAYLFLGHHLDDDLETMVFRLFRGSGIDGLAGMSARRALASRITTQVLRPLLHFRKRTIELTLTERFQTCRWIEDPSNSSQVYDRNRVRKVRRLLVRVRDTPEVLRS